MSVFASITFIMRENTLLVVILSFNASTEYLLMPAYCIKTILWNVFPWQLDKRVLFFSLVSEPNEGENICLQRYKPEPKWKGKATYDFFKRRSLLIPALTVKFSPSVEEQCRSLYIYRRCQNLRYFSKMSPFNTNGNLPCCSLWLKQ